MCFKKKSGPKIEYNEKGFEASKRGNKLKGKSVRVLVLCHWPITDSVGVALVLIGSPGGLKWPIRDGMRSLDRDG